MSAPVVPGTDEQRQAADVCGHSAQEQRAIRHRVSDAPKTAGYLSRRMMPATKIPKFKSEKDEAEWWDTHPEVITELFLRAKKAGKLKRLPLVRSATKPVTLRMPITDIDTAQAIAQKRGLPYQTFIKGLLHQALERE